MKKKRIVLHACILILAVICIVSVVLVFQMKSNAHAKEYYEEDYMDEYEEQVDEVINYTYYQNLYRENFMDLDKVVAQNDELGKITVRDIIDIYNGNDDEEYDELYYEEYEEYLSLYDFYVMKRNEWGQKAVNNPTDENKALYEYYKTVCRKVALYEICMNNLYEQSNTYALPDEHKEKQLEQSYVGDDDFFYYVKYKSGNQEYVFSNVKNEDEISSSGQYVNICRFENGEFLPESGLANEEYISEIRELLSANSRDFLTQNAIKMSFGINHTGDGYFSTVNKQIENAPDRKQIKEIEKNMYICLIVALASVILSLIPFIMLLMMAGHRKKGDQASLMRMDALWGDVMVVVVFAASLFTCFAIENYMHEFRAGSWDAGIFIGISIIVVLVLVEVVIQTCESLARRIKTKNLWKTTFVAKAMRSIKKVYDRLMADMKLSVKIVVFGVALCAWEVFLTVFVSSYNEGLLDILIFTVAPIVAICYLAWKYFDENNNIEDGAKRIAGGDVNYKIEDKMKFRANESMKNTVNNIGEGLNAAVAESIKNERMKTELITNVSHDLKTPLTSIINYVDLLKTEGLNSENAAKYLDVLDKKTQRLKNLTEDLVEASKLTSGAIKLDREKIDLVQLVDQSLGEYNEKFREKHLEVIKTVPESPAYVLADGRKTWRVFENLYGNVYKYAMTGTRVYIDVKTMGGKVFISVKNISENPLNFNAEELMERFVRGDVSRNTEGSGLGLSIARSIVERQNGEMKITLDGDLFKVEIVMNLIS